VYTNFRRIQLAEGIIIRTQPKAWKKKEQFKENYKY
jgi:hypothetical protein